MLRLIDKMFENFQSKHTQKIKETEKRCDYSQRGLEYLFHCPLTNLLKDALQSSTHQLFFGGVFLFKSAEEIPFGPGLKLVELFRGPTLFPTCAFV